MSPSRTARRRRRPILLPPVLLAVTLSVALVPVCPGQAGEPPEGISPAALEVAETVITAPVLEAPIRFLSDDLLEGRGTASRGDRLTQLYLASSLGLLGLRPGGPGGSWYQPFDVVGITAQVPPTWTFHPTPDNRPPELQTPTAKGENNGGPELQSALELHRGDDFIAFSGVQEPRAEISDAELVFVGYGIQAPEYDWDDYGDADLRGKVLVMLNNDPDWDPELFEGERRLYYGRWTYKYESAAAQGAVGAIIVHTTPSAGYPWQVVRTSWTGEQFELPAGDEPRLQIGAWTSEEASRRLFALAGRDYDSLVAAARSRDFRPVPLGIRTSLELNNSLSRVETANVLGMLAGSDPELSEQAVVLTAHHDHLGMAPKSEGDDGDRIYNGALDNASGVSTLLAIARAASRLPHPPARSLLFLFVGAEEQGLLGSKYFAAHPTVPPGRLAANLNFDGANIWGATRDLTLIGMGKSDLDQVAEQVAAYQGRTVQPDQFPDKGYYYRSDQFSLAKIGVPALYFDTGTDFVDRPAGWGKDRVDEWTAEHYHQPSDELTETWNYDGMVQDARLGFLATLLVANRPGLPRWTPGDEFEAARRKALQDLAPTQE